MFDTAGRRRRRKAAPAGLTAVLLVAGLLVGPATAGAGTLRRPATAAGGSAGTAVRTDDTVSRGTSLGVGTGAPLLSRPRHSR